MTPRWPSGVGVLPLALAGGAASGAQIAIGTGVLGGIITATVLAIFSWCRSFPGRGRLTGMDARRKQPAPHREPLENTP